MTALGMSLSTTRHSVPTARHNARENQQEIANVQKQNNDSQIGLYEIRGQPGILTLKKALEIVAQQKTGIIDAVEYPVRKTAFWCTVENHIRAGKGVTDAERDLIQRATNKIKMDVYKLNRQHCPAQARP